ncbi:MAG: cyclic nucleotide-binding domain-containing protein [Bdellovibrionaceae bacterium]|nr:cyclic nucleotide-binding domain-containing protein [Pseudobdellovibrionaceae bacterium]
MADIEGKRIFLVVTGQAETNSQLENLIRAHVQGATVFAALDGAEALFKCANVMPQVVILDFNISKTNAIDITEKLIRRKERIAVIILAPALSEHEYFMDQVVTGQVQFLSGTGVVSIFGNHLTRAMNWVTDVEKALYRLKFLNPKERLLNQGDKAEFVYLVKSGELKALRKDGEREVILGAIHSGEFVGEMAYINGEARSASVEATTACELIEIPSESLDAVLFSKPAWSKALLRTLTKRLKNSNEAKATKPG